MSSKFSEDLVSKIMMESDTRDIHSWWLLVSTLTFHQPHRRVCAHTYRNRTTLLVVLASRWALSHTEGNSPLWNTRLHTRHFTFSTYCSFGESIHGQGLESANARPVCLWPQLSIPFPVLSTGNSFGQHIQRCWGGGALNILMPCRPLGSCSNLFELEGFCSCLRIWGKTRSPVYVFSTFLFLFLTAFYRFQNWAQNRLR